MPLRPPYNIVAEVAPGADPSAPPSTWNFTSDGVRWRAKAGIQIANGRDDESSLVEAGTCDLTFDDRSFKLSPRNVLGEWYGQIDKNTPMRVVLDAVNDTFTRTVSPGMGNDPTSGKQWQQTSPSMWSVNGSVARVTIPTANTAQFALLMGPLARDVDVYSSASVDAMPTGGAWVHATVIRFATAANHYRVHTEFIPGGSVQVKIVRVLDGVLSDLAVLVVPGLTYVAGQQLHTHVRAIGRAIQMRVWTGASEPSVWHVEASDGAVLGTQVGMYEWRLATNAGTFSASIDNYRARVTIWGGQVPEWPVRWPDKSGKDTTAPIQGAGVLRWLDSGSQPPDSPISHYLSGQKVKAGWALEDGPDSTAASSRTGAPPGRVVDATFGNDDAPPGALSSLSLNTSGVSKINVKSPSTVNEDGFHFIIWSKFPSLPAASPAKLFCEVYATGSVARFAVTVDAASFNLTGYDAGGGQYFTSGGVLTAIDVTKWFGMRIRVTHTGANYTYELSWFQVGVPGFAGISGTFPGIVGRATGAGCAAPVDGTLITQMWLVDQSMPFVGNSIQRMSDAYRGETDIARITRVLGDMNTTVVIEPGEGVPLGPQPRAATTLEIVRDAEKAGLGILYEANQVLGYIPRAARVGPPVMMALTWGVDIHEPPEPVDDDQRLVNRFTASRPSGGESTVEDPIAGARVRVYPATDEFNVQTDDQLDDIASWKVAEGTADRLRWPRVVIYLHARPELIPLWLACRVGSRITISAPHRALAGEVIDLIIEGYTQTISKTEWVVELSCSPSFPWANAGVIDGDMSLDTEGSRIATAANATATSLSVETTSGPRWVTTAEDAASFPFDANIGGIRVTVTGITGTGTTQTFTVLRNVDGFDKPFPVGTDVRLWSPIYPSL